MDTRITVDGNLVGLVGTGFENAMAIAIAYLEISPKAKVFCQCGARREPVERDTFKIYGTATGRLSSGKNAANKSNIPKSIPTRKAKLSRRGH